MLRALAMSITDFKKLLFFIVVCQLAGVIGSLFTFSSIPTWYAALVKPSFSPPNWLFGPVWVVLYTLMGISAYLAYNSKIKRKNIAITAFAIQLALNALWPIVFFGMHSILGGLAIIVLLWVSIAITIWKFYQVDRNSGYLLIPYLLWVSFAAALNYFIWVLN